ncbi:hypothetical protein CHS0354_022739 [Potamilus streckersoni]|uniref:Uncharacterized protein n=1 Tax=Potamilus streckersoni TaxID=2493646 RepID=A0AAE0RTA9_9BIVA|nr:hypothetical protein CHS0354_022739 [Potamilus streckersoni]
MVMDPLLENIRGLPVELRERIYRELVKIQVKRKELLHPLRHRCLNHWYLNAIKGLILKKVFKWSDISRHRVGKKCIVSRDYMYFQLHLLNRIPEDELESYHNLEQFVNLVEEETSDRLVTFQLVTREFRFENGIKRLCLWRNYGYMLAKKK